MLENFFVFVLLSIEMLSFLLIRHQLLIKITTLSFQYTLTSMGSTVQALKSQV